MAGPANEENPRWKRWLLFIRAVYDRTDLVEVKDVTLVPLPDLWLGDFVEETGYPFVEQPSTSRRSVTRRRRAGCSRRSSGAWDVRPGPRDQTRGRSLDCRRVRPAPDAHAE
jgi:hypothetical protein